MTRLSGGGGALLADIWIEFDHQCLIFPEDTNETVTFTANVAANTWTTWIEIVDNNAVTLSSKFATHRGHIGAFSMEEADTNAARYQIELAFGSSTGATGITAFRFYIGAAPIQSVNQFRTVHSAHIPAGQTVWARVKCSAATPNIIRGNFRYHLHS